MDEPRQNQHLLASLAQDPLALFVSRNEDAVLAVIIGVEGPSYRPVGAMMVFFANGDYEGSLSSGCIESDLAIHAKETLSSSTPKQVRYGIGSPYFDIQLPCGGGLDVLLIPNPNRDVLEQLCDCRAVRSPCGLQIEIPTGELKLVDECSTGISGTTFKVSFEPDTRFLIFGKGPETLNLAALVHSAGYSNLILAPDTETLEKGAELRCQTQHLQKDKFPSDLAVDPWTAIVLFFHDHEWEPQILIGALATQAFYIGAQGSQKARDARLEIMRAMNVSEKELARLTGPVGLIPSARDARTLAISVLAEVLAHAKSAKS